MTVSVAGLLVCAALFTLGCLMRAPIIVGLFASLPFGSTAFATITALGGSSPLIYTLFALLLISSMLFHRHLAPDLIFLFRRSWVPWVVCALALYVACSAWILPRLFAGRTSAFVATPGGGVSEVLLAPVSGNITQPAYFALGAMTFFAFAVLLSRGHHIAAVRRGVFVWATLHAALGVVDLAGKMIGAGDVLLPIRTAHYALLVETSQGGFWRIAGGFPETSSYSAMTLACSAFAFTYWRATLNIYAFSLLIVLGVLLLLSTSGTAYAGSAIVAIPVAVCLANAAARGRYRIQDLALIGLGSVAVTALAAMYLYDSHAFHRLHDVLETAALNKPMSGSWRERTYWNLRSMTAFFETSGLGVGMGSSRSSSWIVSVISQLGVFGSVMMAALVIVLLRDLVTGVAGRVYGEADILASAARAAGLAWLTAASVSFGSADPGVLFFICLAVVVTCRQTNRVSSAASRGLHGYTSGAR